MFLYRALFIKIMRKKDRLAILTESQKGINISLASIDSESKLLLPQLFEKRTGIYNSTNYDSEFIIGVMPFRDNVRLENRLNDFYSRHFGGKFLIPQVYQIKEGRNKVILELEAVSLQYSLYQKSFIKDRVGDYFSKLQGSVK